MLLFIDTNIFVQSQYGWSSGKLASIKTLSQNGWLKILSHSVVKEEINRHIEHDLKREYESYNSFVKKSSIKGYNKELGLDIGPIDIEKMISLLKEKCNDYFSGDDVIDVPITNKGINVLVGDYINKSYPFEESKPNEFKDAIIIYSLKEFQAIQGVPIIIYSSDKGFNKAFESNSGFTIVEEFGEILKRLENNGPNFIQQHLLNVLEENETKVIIEEYLSELDVELSDEDYFIDSFDIIDTPEVEISNLKLDDFNIVFYDSDGNKVNSLNFKSGNGQIFATIEAFFDIIVSFSMLDVDRSYYDKESHDYLIKSYIAASRSYSTSHIVELKLEFIITEGLIEFEDISVNDNNDVLTLYEYELFDQSYSSSYDERYYMPFEED